MIVPTGAGSFANDMIADNEVYHTLKIGSQEDVRRDACNFGDKTGVAPIAQLNNETLDFLTESLECLTSWKGRVCFWFLAVRDDNAVDDDER